MNTTKDIDGVAVLVQYNGQVHQLNLSKADEGRLITFLTTLFFQTGRNFELVEAPIDDLELKRNSNG